MNKKYMLLLMLSLSIVLTGCVNGDNNKSLLNEEPKQEVVQIPNEDKMKENLISYISECRFVTKDCDVEAMIKKMRTILSPSILSKLGYDEDLKIPEIIKYTNLYTYKYEDLKIDTKPATKVDSSSLPKNIYREVAYKIDGSFSAKIDGSPISVDFSFWFSKDAIIQVALVNDSYLY